MDLFTAHFEDPKTVSVIFDSKWIDPTYDPPINLSPCIISPGARRSTYEPVKHARMLLIGTNYGTLGIIEKPSQYCSVALWQLIPPVDKDFDKIKHLFMITEDGGITDTILQVLLGIPGYIRDQGRTYNIGEWLLLQRIAYW